MVTPEAAEHSNSYNPLYRVPKVKKFKSNFQIVNILTLC